MLVNLILDIAMPIRLGVLALFGMLVGGQLNRGIYRLAWNSRSVSPWSPPPDGAPARRVIDRVPVIGWIAMRRERSWHGAGFWVRPMLIELGTGAGFTLLYWLEVQRQILWPASIRGAGPDMVVLHSQVFSHLVLICLMIVATFIDFDEQTIPDEITVPGTILGLLLAAALPACLLPTLFQPAYGSVTIHQLVLTSSTVSMAWREGIGGPWSWPTSLDRPFGLAVVLVAVWSWCFAILHKTWTVRRGLGRAVLYMVVSIWRRRTWPVPLGIAVALSGLAVGIWSVGGQRWEALLSAAVGMVFGGGLIWAVRIVGGHALQAEAMGFGDVTLMAMIGAFLGWQPALLIFFLAPFSALIIALAQWLFTGDRHIAFGPYLCLATLIVLVKWQAVWTDWAMPMFGLGWFIPGMVGCCLVLMGGLLWGWRLAREAMFVEV